MLNIICLRSTAMTQLVQRAARMRNNSGIMPKGVDNEFIEYQSVCIPSVCTSFQYPRLTGFALLLSINEASKGAGGG